MKDELDIDFKTTEDLTTPELLIDQVIGQDEGVAVIEKAAVNKRNVLLIGASGTGKSMLGQAMAELIPKEKLEDVLVVPNKKDPNTPKIIVLPAGSGERIVEYHTKKSRKGKGLRSALSIIFPLAILILAIITGQWLFGVLVALICLAIMSFMKGKSKKQAPKLLINNNKKEYAPFLEGTGAHAGAMLGDVRHDPYQSGGLGTPAHLRVEAGLIHKASKGILFIDEMATMRPKTQHDLLTAMQERRFHITGQSEHGSGAMVRTEPVPCDFVLVAAGNLDTVQKMHPALRSRIRGYGYEVFINEDMEDTIENRRKYAYFVAQEIKKDGKIPHFTRKAVIEIIREGRRKACRKGYLTLFLRDLGGLIRVAGDIALVEKTSLVTAEHILRAKKVNRSLEHQIGDKTVERKREYEVILTEGSEIGRVNGLAVYGNPKIGASGFVQPIEALVTPNLGSGGKVIATGKLGEMAKESVDNVSAYIKKAYGEDISNYDIHIQFLQAYDGLEGDSASISIAVAVFSSLRDIPVKQSVAMTGSLSVRGKVLPIGGATTKIEAAIESGMKKVIIPESNLKDVVLESRYKEKIEIIPVKTIEDVLQHTLVFEAEGS